MARPASDIAERIVRAARDRFLVEGVDGASLRAIARDAGTNLGMVYYYYPSKDDLFFAVIEDVYAKLIDDVTRSVSEPGLDTHAIVERMYARLAAISDDELKVVRLVLREGFASASTRIARLFERFSRGHIALLSGMLSAGLARGEVRSDIPPMVMVLSCVALGLVPQILRRRLEEAGLVTAQLLPPPEELAHALASLLLGGIARPEASAANDVAAQRYAAVEVLKKPRARRASTTSAAVKRR